MSTGSIVGGIAGGIAGWFIGGPYGAYVGFTLGYGIGAMIDPIRPDRLSPGQPVIGDLVVNFADEGLVLPDVLGTTKLNGNIVWYDGDHTVEVTEEVEVGGKGGGDTQTVVTGYEYYLTWAMVLCLGPVDKLYTIYKNDTVVWEGELDRPAGGVSTLVLDGMGSVTFYWGTAEHGQTSTIGDFLDDSTLNVPYRNQCWILFNDCLMGNYNRAPTMKFVLGKYPEFDFNPNNIIGTYDYNPAHAVYYVTNTMANMPSTYVDDATFSGVAETLIQEELGVSILFDSYQTTETWLEGILYHVGGLIRFSNNGRFELKLIRADTTVSGMPTIEAGEALVDNYDFSRISWAETINQEKIQYAQRVFLEPVCPFHSEGYDDTGVSGVTDNFMEANTTYWLTINNEESQEYFGLDCTTDFLYSTVGTFGDIIRNDDGSWSFEFHTGNLCVGDNPPCPIIFGNEYECCLCEQADAVEYSGENPQTMTGNGTAVVTTSGGLGPYDWVVDGVGAWLDAGHTVKTLQTANGTATVYGSGAEGTVQVDVTDSCSTTDTGYIRAPGKWYGPGVTGGNCGQPHLGLCYYIYTYHSTVHRWYWRYKIDENPGQDCWLDPNHNDEVCSPFWDDHWLDDALICTNGVDAIICIPNPLPNHPHPCTAGCQIWVPSAYP